MHYYLSCFEHLLMHEVGQIETDFSVLAGSDLDRLIPTAIDSHTLFSRLYQGEYLLLIQHDTPRVPLYIPSPDVADIAASDAYEQSMDDWRWGYKVPFWHYRNSAQWEIQRQLQREEEHYRSNHFGQAPPPVPEYIATSTEYRRERLFFLDPQWIWVLNAQVDQHIDLSAWDMALHYLYRFNHLLQAPQPAWHLPPT